MGAPLRPAADRTGAAPTQPTPVIADGAPQLATGQPVEVTLSLTPMTTPWFALTPNAGSAPRYALRVQVP
jgi:hypothetical protein